MIEHGVGIRKCNYEDAQTLRKLYLREQNCQIRYDSCHYIYAAFEITEGVRECNDHLSE